MDMYIGVRVYLHKKERVSVYCLIQMEMKFMLDFGRIIFMREREGFAIHLRSF
jgi:hypothetical protein